MKKMTSHFFSTFVLLIGASLLSACGGGGGGGNGGSSGPGRNGFRVFNAAIDLAPTVLTDTASGEAAVARFARLSSATLRPDAGVSITAIGGAYTVTGEETFPFTLAVFGNGDTGYGLLPLPTGSVEGAEASLRVVHLAAGASTASVTGLGDPFSVPFGSASPYVATAIGSFNVSVNLSGSVRSFPVTIPSAGSYALIIAGERQTFITGRVIEE